jgi:hypothetical protein
MWKCKATSNQKRALIGLSREPDGLGLSEMITATTHTRLLAFRAFLALDRESN